MMKVQKQNTNSSCSTPSDFRKQSWAELSEDLLTDSEPGAWESERYTDLESSPQTSPMQSPVQSPAMAKNEAMSGAWESERYTDLESSPQTSPMQSPVQSPAMAKNEAMSGGLGNGDFVPQPNYSIAFPVIDIAGLPKALCNNVCVEAMLQQAGLTNGVSGFMTDETSTVRVMLANWPSAMHCMDHFKKSSWAGGSLQITMGLAIPQAAQQVSAAECYPQNSPTGNSQMNYFGASMNSDAFDCAAY